MLYDIEQSIKDAQAKLTQSKEAHFIATRGPPKQHLAFLKKLNDDGACVLVDRQARKMLNIRDSLDKAIAEDIEEVQSSSEQESESDSSEDSITRAEKRTKKII